MSNVRYIRVEDLSPGRPQFNSDGPRPFSFPSKKTKTNTGRGRNRWRGIAGFTLALTLLLGGHDAAAQATVDTTAANVAEKQALKAVQGAINKISPKLGKLLKIGLFLDRNLPNATTPCSCLINFLSAANYDVKNGDSSAMRGVVNGCYKWPEGLVENQVRELALAKIHELFNTNAKRRTLNKLLRYVRSECRERRNATGTGGSPGTGTGEGTGAPTGSGSGSGSDSDSDSGSGTDTIDGTGTDPHTGPGNDHESGPTIGSGTGPVKGNGATGTGSATTPAGAGVTPIAPCPACEHVLKYIKRQEKLIRSIDDEIIEMEKQRTNNLSERIDKETEIAQLKARLAAQEGNGASSHAPNGNLITSTAAANGQVNVVVTAPNGSLVSKHSYESSGSVTTRRKIAEIRKELAALNKAYAGLVKRIASYKRSLAKQKRVLQAYIQLLDDCSNKCGVTVSLASVARINPNQTAFASKSCQLDVGETSELNVFMAHADGRAMYSSVLDLDENGTPDVVTLDPSADLMTVQLGLGDGSLEIVQEIETGGGPATVHAADVNDDQVPDVVVANLASSDAWVFLGNGDGTLRLGTIITLGEGPHSIDVRDVDGDRNVDLVVYNQGTADVSLSFGYGDGEFEDEFVPNIGAVTALSVSDVDQDGLPDLVLNRVDSFVPSIGINLGDGTFTPSILFEVPDLAAIPAPAGIPVTIDDGAPAVLPITPSIQHETLTGPRVAIDTKSGVSPIFADGLDGAGTKTSVGITVFETNYHELKTQTLSPEAALRISPVITNFQEPQLQVVPRDLSIVSPNR